MEHRWGERLSCDIAVKVFANPASVAWGRIRDISVSGAFIETKLPLRSLATLRVTRGASRQTVGAIVVRRDVDGVGVEWVDADGEAIAALIREVRSRRRPAARAAVLKPALPPYPQLPAP